MRLRPVKAQLILGFVETYLELTAKEELKLQRETAKFPREDQEKIMKMLLPGERHGRYEGRKEGRQEGRHEMLREAVLDILETRFKRVPFGVREKIEKIPTEIRLRQLLHQAAVADNLETFGSNH